MTFAFGDHELDPERFELRRRGRGVEIQPKALEVLVYLVRHRDRVVSKQEMLHAIWPDAMVTDGSLARAVSLARLAIEDRGPAPTVIVTVPRRGYRFHAAVRERPVGAGAPAPRASSAADTAQRYVGRQDLIERLASSLDAALGGRGRILFLAGEAGIGKTRTAELLAESARDAGALVVTAWGLADGAAPAYWAWSRVLRALASAAGDALPDLVFGHAASLARLAPELVPGEPADETGAARDGGAARFRLFEAMQRVLQRVAEKQPLALFLDDVHWADAESLWLLEFVGHALGTLPVVIVVTCREDDASRTPQRARALERLLRLSALERWPLSGLESAEVHDFVRVRLGGEPDPSLVEALQRKTGGNPLLLGESLRSLAARGLLGGARNRGAWEALLPEGIQHLVRHKLRQLSPAAVAVVGCAAAVGVEIDRGVLERCVPDLSARDLAAGLAEAEEAGLLLAPSPTAARLRFSHVLVREALYVELAPLGDARRAFHARIADALEAGLPASDATLAERAHHACEAAPLIDPLRAVALARAAGESAARLHEFEQASAWYERALAMLALSAQSAPPLRVELWLGLGAAQARALGLERARPTYRQASELARAIGRGDLFAAATLGFAHRPTATGQGDPLLIELLEEALRLLPSGHDALRIRLLSRLAADLRYAENARAEALLEEAVAAARHLGDAAALAQALDDSSFVRWSPADPEGWIALNAEITRAAYASGDLELALLGHKGRVTAFLELGDVAAMSGEIDACERAAAELRTPYARWLSTALRATRALLEGRLEDADQHVSESIPLGERAESPDVAVELQAQIVYLRLEQGRAGEIEEAARAQVRRFPDAPAWRAALARSLVATGQLLEARRELEQLARQRFSDVPRDRGWLPTLALATEVAHATGAVRHMQLLDHLLLPYARLGVVAGSGLLFYGSVSHHLGLVAASRGRWEDAIDRLEAATASHERMGARIWQARSRLALARSLLGRGGAGDRSRAAALVRQAEAMAQELALAELAAEVRQLAPRLEAWPGVGPV